MKIKLPRALDMRIMLSIALLQLLLVGVFSVFWVFEAVSNELSDRQAVAHKTLALVLPAVERAVHEKNLGELKRYLNRVLADPLVNSLVIKDMAGQTLFSQAAPMEPLHPLAQWFKSDWMQLGVSAQLWRDGASLGFISIKLSNQAVNQDIRNLLENVAYLLFILLALDLIAIQILVKKFVSPIGSLTVMAQAFTQGNLDTTIVPDESASDEVQHLTTAFIESAKVMRQQIDDLEQTRGQLASNELRLRNLVNNMREVLLELDRSGKILFLNPAWEKLTGYPVEQCLNKPFSYFLAQPQHQAHFVFGRLEQLPTFDMQIEVRAQSGDSVWLRISSTLQRDAQNAFYGMVSTL